MRQQVLILFLLLSTCSLILGQDIFDIECKVRGLNYFRADPRDTLTEPSKTELNDLLELYSRKKNEIESFVKALDINQDSALRIKKRDKVLSKEDSALLLIVYDLGKFKDYNMLFYPWFWTTEALDKMSYVKCTVAQLEQLRHASDNELPLIFRCKFLGHISNDIKAYELISYNLPSDR